MDVEKMTIEALEKRLAEVTEELARVKTQLDFAKSKAAVTRDFSNKDWFNRARHAMRMKGREHQLILAELGKRRKAERSARNDSVERRFMQVAKRRLAPSLFMELVAEAEEC